MSRGGGIVARPVTVWRRGVVLVHAKTVSLSAESISVPRFDGKGVLQRAGALLAGFEASSISAVLHAACSSPTSRQAMASCSALLMSSWAAPPAGSRIATADDLAGLVESLRAECPDLATVEDFLPLDPRERVRFRGALEGEAWDFRVHPGGLESPLQALQGVLNYAEALDPVLAPRLGFGVTDMLRLAGVMLEAELEVLSPVWGGGQVTRESPPEVTEPEVDASRRFVERWKSGDFLQEQVFRLRDGNEDDRLLRAAEIVTVDYQDLSFDAGPDLAHVGPALLVRVPGGLLPVPSALIVESLTAAVTASLKFAVRHREDSAREGEPSGSS